MKIRKGLHYTCFRDVVTEHGITPYYAGSEYVAPADDFIRNEFKEDNHRWMPEDHPELYFHISAKDAEKVEAQDNIELKSLATPLHDYLRRNHHPHAAIIVDYDGVRVVEDIRFEPIKFDEK